MLYLNTNFPRKVNWVFFFDLVITIPFPRNQIILVLNFIYQARHRGYEYSTVCYEKSRYHMCSDTMPLSMSSVLTFLTFVIACITLTKMNWGKNVLVRLIIYLPIKPYFRNENRLLDGHINNGIKLCRQLEQDRAVHLLFSVQSPTSSKYIEYLKSFFMFSKILHRHILSLLIFV